MEAERVGSFSPVLSLFIPVFPHSIKRTRYGLSKEPPMHIRIMASNVNHDDECAYG